MFKKEKISEKELTTQSNFLSQTTIIEGNIKAQGNFRLEGTVVGNVECSAKFILSETSKIQGNLYATNAEISGEVLGDIEIKELLSLKASARITGNIKSTKLLVEPGATINGNFKTNPANIAAPSTSPGPAVPANKKPEEKTLA